MSSASPLPALRVVIADDHPIWREAVERDLVAAGLEVVGTAGDGHKAVRVVLATQPDVLVCDLQMPGLTGVEVTRAVIGDPAAAAAPAAPAPAAAAPHRTRVLVLSASGEQADVLEAVKAGATGYLLKSASAPELVDAVRRTAAGDAVFTPGLAGLVLGEYRRTATDDGAPRLTDRETEVLRLVAKGLTAKQVAERLVLSHRTVENHVQNTLSKLQLHNRVQLVRYAVEKGLTE